MKAIWSAALLGCVVSLGVPASAGAAQAQNARPNQRQMRFAGMDRNGDGVITRDEWNGNDRAFRNHDWNGDNVLSGDEVRSQSGDTNWQRDQGVDDRFNENDWSEREFTRLDVNRDGRISRAEWPGNDDVFVRVDRNRDGSLSLREFLGYSDGDDAYLDRDDRFAELDRDGDGRIERREWRGSDDAFGWLDSNGDGVIDRAELRASQPFQRDVFSRLDSNGDRVISRDEWFWSASAFERRDRNNDGVLTADEFYSGDRRANRDMSPAFDAGYARGLEEGRKAGRGDKVQSGHWDLEGQRELERADSGYDQTKGSLPDYQAGYRAGFRVGYREGFGPR
jgi:Ca2+-binding EF-hand superfamily protein